MRWAIYIRVSSVGQNVAGQRREIQRWLDGNNVPGDQTEWFIDTASGKDLERPAFERLQTAVFNGDVQAIVVWKLDRLSRNLRDGINTLADWCDRGMRVVAVTQQIDFNGALGKMLAAVLLGVAEMERESIRERQAVGIAAAKERGTYKGRRPGATKAKPARAQELRATGLKDHEIATSLGVTKRTVQRYLAASQ
jgi:DNA invertase Pin-like site-specific DNA recombinase